MARDAGREPANKQDDSFTRILMPTSTIFLSSRLSSAVLPLNNKQAGYYVCGPADFLQDVKTGLVANDVDDEKIKLKSFGAGGS